MCDSIDIEPIESLIGRLCARLDGMIFVGVQDQSPKPPLVFAQRHYASESAHVLVSEAIDNLVESQPGPSGQAI